MFSCFVTWRFNEQNVPNLILMKALRFMTVLQRFVNAVSRISFFWAFPSGICLQEQEEEVGDDERCKICSHISKTFSRRIFTVICAVFLHASQFPSVAFAFECLCSDMVKRPFHYFSRDIFLVSWIATLRAISSSDNHNQAKWFLYNASENFEKDERSRGIRQTVWIERIRIVRYWNIRLEMVQWNVLKRPLFTKHVALKEISIRQYWLNLFRGILSADAP